MGLHLLTRVSIIPVVSILFCLVGPVGCGGSGGEGAGNGGLEILSVNPESGVSGTELNVCANGASDAIVTICGNPVAALSVLALADSSDESECEGSEEIRVRVPEDCPQGEVEVKVVSGTEESNAVTFTITEGEAAPSRDETTGSRRREPTNRNRGGPSDPDGPDGPDEPDIPDPDPDGSSCVADSECETDYLGQDCETWSTGCRCDSVERKCIRNPECIDGPEGNATCNSDEERECGPRGCLCRNQICEVIPVCDATTPCPTGRRCEGTGIDARCVEIPVIPGPFLEIEANEAALFPEGIETDRLEYGAIKLTTQGAREAYIYGDFGVRTRYAYNPCRDAASVNCGLRPEADGQIWVDFDMPTGDPVPNRIQPEVFLPDEIDNFDTRRLTDSLASPYQEIDWENGDFSECWPEVTDPVNPHYCRGIEDYLSEHIPLGLRTGYPLNSGERVYRYRVKNINGEEKLVFKAFKPEHKFVAVVTMTDPSETAPRIVEPSEFELARPRVQNCLVTPYKYGPFVKVDMTVTGGVTGATLNVRNVPGWTTFDRVLDSDVRAGRTTWTFYVPIKSPDFKITCYALGLRENAAKAYSIHIGSVQNGRVNLDTDLEDWEAVEAINPPTAPSDQRNCSDPDVLYHDRVEADPSLDKEVGRCDARLNLLFSQRMTVTPASPIIWGGRTCRDACQTMGPAHEESVEEYRTPFAGEIRIVAYQDRASATRVRDAYYDLYTIPQDTENESRWGRLMRRIRRMMAPQTIETEGDCLYHFVAADSTGGGVLTSPATINTAYEGRDNDECTNAFEELDSEKQGDRDSYKLKGHLNRERPYESANYYRIWIKQFGESQQGMGAIPRWESFDLRYFSELTLAHNDIFEIAAVSDLINAWVGEVPWSDWTDWTIRIPFQAQHLKDPPAVTLQCWGADIDGQDLIRNEGWRDTGASATYFGWIYRRYSGGRRSRLVQAGSRFESATVPLAFVHGYNGQDMRQRGDLSEGPFAVDAGELLVGTPSIQYQGKFRNCRVQVTAEGWDGRSYDQTIEVPSENHEALLEIPEALVYDGVNPSGTVYAAFLTERSPFEWPY